MNRTTPNARKLRTAAYALAALVALPAMASAQEAEEKSWGLQLSVADYSSAYWFRGIDMLQKEPVLVPHATVTFGGGFSAYWWGFRGDLGETGPDYFENDFGLDYTFPATDELAITFGALRYTYLDPQDFDDTTEVYAVAALDTLLAPKLSVFYDIGLFDGAYASMGFSHGFELQNDLTVTPSAVYGHNFEWTEKALFSELPPSTKPNDVLLGIDVAWSRGALALHAAAQKSIALAALDALGQEDFEIFTLGGSFSF